MNIFDSWGMGGLIKVNLKAYFDLTRDGMGHNEALALLLKSRYTFEPGKVTQVASLWRDARQNNADYAGVAKKTPPKEADIQKDELRELLLNMYYVETHIDKVDPFERFELTIKFEAKFDELYDKLKR